MWQFNHVLDSFFSLFLKSNCPLCQRPAEQEFCRFCIRQLQDCRLIDNHKYEDKSLSVLVWGGYFGGLKRAIKALKYDRQCQLARPLGTWLGEAWLQSSLSSNRAIVVPIPLHIQRQQIRGFNQAEILAESFCRVTGLQLQKQGLQRLRSTEAMFGLSGQQRQKNLIDAFSLGKDFLRKPPISTVLLLDDIYTTGATARAAASILQQHGIHVSGVVAIAKTFQKTL